MNKEQIKELKANIRAYKASVKERKTIVLDLKRQLVAAKDGWRDARAELVALENELKELKLGAE